MQLPIARLTDWAAWLEHWHNPTLSFEERMGLLRHGFELPTGDFHHAAEPAHQARSEVGRAIFYLKLADGHRGPAQNFVDTTGMDVDERWSQPMMALADARQALAQTAFDMVAQHLLQPALSSGPFAQRHSELLTTQPVLDQVLRFYRTDSNHGYPLQFVNVGQPDNHRERPTNSTTRAYDFALQLAGCAWNLPKQRDLKSYESQQRLASERHRFIDLLLACEQLEQLLLPRTNTIDDASWQHLEELALREQWLPVAPADPVGTRVRREPFSLEEAAAFGGSEARLLLLLRNKRDQEQRLRQPDQPA
jgi:hypothetical protein